jgi:hypothetical protein
MATVWFIAFSVVVTFVGAIILDRLVFLPKSKTWRKVS